MGVGGGKGERLEGERKEGEKNLRDQGTPVGAIFSFPVTFRSLAKETGTDGHLAQGRLAITPGGIKKGKDLGCCLCSWARPHCCIRVGPGPTLLPTHRG